MWFRALELQVRNNRNRREILTSSPKEPGEYVSRLPYREKVMLTCRTAGRIGAPCRHDFGSEAAYEI